jgi:hypothetical protein
MSSSLRLILILTVALAWMVIVPAWVSSFGMCVSCGSNYPTYPTGDEALWRAEAYYFMCDNCDNFNFVCGASHTPPVFNQTNVNLPKNSTMPQNITAAPWNATAFKNATMPENLTNIAM